MDEGESVTFMKSYCIIPDNKKVEANICIRKKEIAIFAHLFYEDQVTYYQKYLEEIPELIDIVIISSKEEILDKFNSSRFERIKKKNRGRDISALLIASRDMFFQYDYVCFVHDKKEKNPDDKDYVDFWKKNMWNNMLQSPIYVYNILELLQNDEKLGLLVPLPPYKRGVGVWLGGGWAENYEHVKELADELGIKVDISYEEPPIAYSTVFWTKTKALKKLFAKDWDYMDFPDEPMRNDGEINHAIERILQYVVEDAGYETKIVMSSSFVARFVEQLRDEVNSLWNIANQELGFKNGIQFDQYMERKETIIQFSKQHSKIYLYGAGKIGKKCLRFCRFWGIVPNGIIVTQMTNTYSEMDGIPILPVSDFICIENAGIIISANAVNQKEIVNELKKINFKEYIIF